jgi:hypothetical protein
MFFRSIDGGHVEALGTLGQCMGWVQQTKLQSKVHYFLHDQRQVCTLIPYRVGQRKDNLCHLCG